MKKQTQTTKKHENQVAPPSALEQEYQEFLTIARDDHTEEFDSYMEEIAAYTAQKQN